MMKMIRTRLVYGWLGILLLVGSPGLLWAQDQQAQIQRLLDENEIRSVIDGYDVAVDAKQWDKVRSYFADEVQFDATSLEGGEPMVINSDDMVGQWAVILFEEKKSNHMRTNFVIEVDGDTATAFSKGYSLNIMDLDNGSDLWEVWGDYTHKLKRTPQGWKINGMRYDKVYARGNEKAHDYIPEK